jgi:hypothetical protein
MSRLIIKAFGQIGPASKDSVPGLLSVIENPDAYITLTIPSIPFGENTLSSRIMYWNELLRLTAISTLGKIGDTSPIVLSSWFDETPDFPQTTMDQALHEAIAAIDRDGSTMIDSGTKSPE